MILSVRTLSLLAIVSLASVAFSDSLLTVSGSYQSVYNDAYSFDGTDFGELPGLFDGIKGGSFVATYLFPTVTPPTDPSFNQASYNFSAPYGISFTLFDSSGAVAMEGLRGTKSASATVSNNVPVYNFGTGLLEGYLDGVELVGTPEVLSGLQTPEALYGTPDTFLGRESLKFDNFSNLSSSNYLTDLNLPIDPATYLAFPGRTFAVSAFWGSGDYNDQVGPFQTIDSHIYYSINSVSITPVPEPSSMAVLATGVFIGGRLKRRRKMTSQ